MMKSCIHAAVVLFASVVFASGCAYNPVSDEYEFALMSRERQIQVGQSSYPKYNQMSDGELADPKLQKYVQKLGTDIAKESHDPELPFQFNVVNSSAPNAYALPGGFISVTRGLLMEMDREAELAAVIGHEIVHSVAQHSAQQMAWSSVSNLIQVGIFTSLSARGTENAEVYAGLTNLAGRGLLASYSRKQESESDRIGMRYMAKAGYDPEGMVDLQKTLMKQRKQKPGVFDQLMSTHPLSEERIAEAKPLAQKLKEQYDISEKRQLNQFQEQVVNRWHPRAEAYAAYDRGVALAEKSKFDAAGDEFRTAISKYDGEALFHAWHGLTQMEQKQYDRARSALKQARSLNGDVYRIQLYSAVLDLRTDNHKSSLNHLNRADKLLPGTPTVTFYEGRNLEALNQEKLAAEKYAKFLDKVRDDSPRTRYAKNKLRKWGYMK